MYVLMASIAVLKFLQVIVLVVGLETYNRKFLLLDKKFYRLAIVVTYLQVLINIVRYAQLIMIKAFLIYKYKIIAL